MPLDKADIIRALTAVPAPGGGDIVSTDVVRNVRYCDGVAQVELAAAPGPAEQREALREAVEAAVRGAGDEVKRVTVSFSMSLSGGGQPQQQRPAQGQRDRAGGEHQANAAADNPLPGVKHIIAVGAGKGGVGKSTVAVNLAVGLARAGASVGLLDADIYGPSLPTMLGTDKLEPQAEQDTLIPFEVHGIRSMTIGALVDPERPLIWRGPMAHSAFRQLATQTRWGELDYLIIDLPPGTGDVPLTLAQLLPLTGAVIVCTPQKVAQDDAVRALRMFQQLEIPVLGIVENMSYFIGDDGKEYDIFGRGGAEMLAMHLGTPFLGTIPINMALRRSADAGDPTANFEGGDALASELQAMVAAVKQQAAAAAVEQAADAPTLTVH